MIQVTNNVKEFLEKGAGEIFIYGAGNAGYWVGHYMIRCGIDFIGFIDKNIDREDATYMGKPVFYPEKLKEYAGKRLRIIVTPNTYETVLADLLWMERKNELDLICLIPRYVYRITKEEGYDINRLLAYFRRKLFKGETPTILSNNCWAGLIYDILDLPMLSPTINTVMTPSDFLKLCQNPKYYLAQDMKEIRWVRGYGNPYIGKDMPAGKLADISVAFAHVESERGLIERWNMLKEKVNWNRLIYILVESEGHFPPELGVLKSFLKCSEKHLLVTMFRRAVWGHGENSIYMEEDYLESRNRHTAIENYFDLLGWINKEYDEQ